MLSSPHGYTTKKTRSRAWIVSTHVITSGILFPALFGLLAAWVLSYTWEGGAGAAGRWWEGPIVDLAVVLGYVLGTFYSVLYIQKSVRTNDPTSCVKPSVVALSVLLFTGLVFRIKHLIEFNQGIAMVTEGALSIIWCSIILVSFYKITEHGFSRIEPAGTL